MARVDQVEDQLAAPVDQARRKLAEGGGEVADLVGMRSLPSPMKRLLTISPRRCPRRLLKPTSGD